MDLESVETSVNPSSASSDGALGQCSQAEIDLLKTESDLENTKANVCSSASSDGAVVQCSDISPVHGPSPNMADDEGVGSSASINMASEEVQSESHTSVTTSSNSTHSDHAPQSSEAASTHSVSNTSNTCESTEMNPTTNESGTINEDGTVLAEERMDTSSVDSFVLGDELTLLTGSWKEFVGNNFLRGCKWAPDGSCLLTCSDDDVMRLYNLPAELYSGTKERLPEITPALKFPHATGIYDFCWYPKMTSWEPGTCCFATSCKDQPIHMWDAFYGHKRASYVPYNHLDEVVSPYSLAFSLDGEKLYAGFKKSFKVFHVSRSGRPGTSVNTYNRKNGGQAGIISCIAMSPTQPGTLAMGSYSCSVALYAENAQRPIFTLTGLSSGVTHLQFTRDGNKLFVGYRKNNCISCWDLRNPMAELVTLEREVITNQRVFFDQTSDGRYLLSGSTNGRVYRWSTRLIEEALSASTESVVPCCHQFEAHEDVINGCSVHPTLPLLATGSGQRSFDINCDSDSDCEYSGSKPTNSDCSVKIWSLC